MYQQESGVSVQALSVLILLTHDSVLFYPTSSSSLKHKRKDERKHKKRSVCDCCIRIMYFPNPTQLFFNPLQYPFFLRHAISPSNLFRTLIAEEERKRILQNTLM